MRKIYLFILSALLMGGITSCDLDVKPNTAVTEDLLTDSTAAIGFLNAAYREMHRFNYYGQEMMVMGDVLADNAEIANNTGRYVAENANQIYAHYGFWFNAYTVINYANYAIDKVEQLLADGKISQSTANQIKGQALFLRALCHFDVARAYGYEPGKEVNGFNLSAVIRTAPIKGASDAEPKPRATNTEVYTQVKNDLLEAINLLNGNDPANAPRRAGKAAAEALLARVYLYEGDYPNAETYAQNALSSTTATISAAADVVSDWDALTVPHPESIFELDINPTIDWSTVDGLNNSLSSLTNNIASNGNNFSVQASADLLALLNAEAGDVRIGFWDQDTQTGFWRLLKWLGGKGGDVNCRNIPVIRYSEVLLIQAEAEARQGKDSEAQTTINILRSNRGLTNTTATGSALIDVIMNERRKELMFEGHRFFDLKRLGQDILKDGGAPLPYNDFKVLAPLSNQDIITSGGVLVQNPGYN
ncbi:RagB/SusD family nutrient uptake outer membrane protein [Thermonema rossianum]|uniref:RagB/SusD family nutrient uptake outer membrane protein n=1 Tax=Thermonema rossianum TaxID=55505 RepID=UPI00068D6AD8|nr:RagB/SusD family nutrient uptake outer membrane protein [Thermonema rossianum]